ncbi:MAG: hypothetical protein MUC48_05140 [Leptolyngbya sp. Prado105]|jgi:hypothetical protein|nr:hypothetical protein [Leptolyngbya sp. Prado105]
MAKSKLWFCKGIQGSAAHPPHEPAHMSTFQAKCSICGLDQASAASLQVSTPSPETVSPLSATPSTPSPPTVTTTEAAPLATSALQSTSTPEAATISTATPTVISAPQVAPTAEQSPIPAVTQTVPIPEVAPTLETQPTPSQPTVLISPFSSNPETETAGHSPSVVDRLTSSPVAISIAASIAAAGLLGGTWFAIPNIPGVCNTLGNCQAWNTELQQVIQAADTAQSEVNQANTLQTLTTAHDRFKAAIAKVESLKTYSKLKSQIETALSKYQPTLAQSEAKLSQEKQAQAQLSNAEAIAQSAKVLSDVSQKEQSPATAEQAQKKWNEAISALNKVPQNTFASKQISDRTQSYTASRDQLNSIIASGIIQQNSQPAPAPMPVVSSGSSEPASYYEPPTQAAYTAPAAPQAPAPQAPAPQAPAAAEERPITIDLGEDPFTKTQP